MNYGIIFSMANYKCAALLAALCCFGVFHYFTKAAGPVLSKNFQDYLPKSDSNRKELMKLSATKKFIVVTSIASPTEDVKKLASQEGWTVVVVGDTKTPSNWSYPGVHFLSVDTQKQLGYKVLSKVPYKSYTRKIIGYLYAIERGAEWIYDTDDDNKPYGKGLSQFDYETEINGLVYISSNAIGNATSKRPTLFQPYAYFGRPDIWPRGFPLEYITNQKNDENRYSFCQKIKAPIIQQGLVSKDPDVDAIYRLLNAKDESGLNEKFSQDASPVVLGPDVYTPFNSQNTLFHRSAFFTLWLPVSVAFRVTDIWRSYFAQKLVQLIGGNVAFYPANAIQFRNAHNYLSDFKEELALYKDAGRMVEMLDSWMCTHNNTADCASALAAKFASFEFWGKDDAELVELWHADLRSLNYSFPPLAYNKAQYTVGQSKGSNEQINCKATKVQQIYAENKQHC